MYVLLLVAVYFTYIRRCFTFLNQIHDFFFFFFFLESCPFLFKSGLTVGLGTQFEKPTLHGFTGIGLPLLSN
jgi:hypothetical protein